MILTVFLSPPSAHLWVASDGLNVKLKKLFINYLLIINYLIKRELRLDKYPQAFLGLRLWVERVGL